MERFRWRQPGSSFLLVRKNGEQQLRSTPIVAANENAAWREIAKTFPPLEWTIPLDGTTEGEVRKKRTNYTRKRDWRTAVCWTQHVG